MQENQDAGDYLGWPISGHRYDHNPEEDNQLRF